MLKLSIEDLKLEFVRTVYEAITKQIQQMDLKISIILSWNGAMAVVLANKLTDVIANKNFHFVPIALMTVIAVTMGVTGAYCVRVLKPRKARSHGQASEGFAGLLYSEDILNLGHDARGRMAEYQAELLAIGNHEELYQQFTKSIVLISEVQDKKNRLFTRGLLLSVFSFVLLLTLMASMGLMDRM